MKNPIIELAELIQARTGENILTRVVGKSGPDHCPIITVEIELPDGTIYTGKGSNKNIAKQNAAEAALEEIE